MSVTSSRVYLIRVRVGVGVAVGVRVGVRKRVGVRVRVGVTVGVRVRVRLRAGPRVLYPQSCAEWRMCATTAECRSGTALGTPG